MWPVRRMGSIPAVSLRVHVVHLAWASTSPVPPSRTMHAVLPHTALTPAAGALSTDGELARRELSPTGTFGTRPLRHEWSGLGYLV